MAFVADLAQDHYDAAVDPPGPVGVTAVARTSIETASGRYFDFADPRAEDVCIEDIAKALSNLCRFNGHVSEFYSVATHSELVADLVSAWREPDDVCLGALLHDAHEAYLNDLTTPLKKLIGPRYGEIRAKIDKAIGEALDIDPELFEHPVVKKADQAVLGAEARELKVSKGNGWQGFSDVELPAHLFAWPSEPSNAERDFLRSFNYWRAV